MSSRSIAGIEPGLRLMGVEVAPDPVLQHQAPIPQVRKNSKQLQDDLAPLAAGTVREDGQRLGHGKGRVEVGRTVAALFAVARISALHAVHFLDDRGIAGLADPGFFGDLEQAERTFFSSGGLLLFWSMTVRG